MKLNIQTPKQSLAARWLPTSSAAVLALIFSTFLALTALGSETWAQNAPVTAIGEARKFPDKSRLGELTIGVFPEASLNGQTARFSASGRLLNTSNMIVVPSTVYRQALVVRYELDFEGNINRAWQLNPVELKIAQEEARKTP
jgi:hypothetical protein